MNTTKKRILWCGESSHICSGFGLYTKEILSRLHATNKYEIAELSCYRDYTVPKNEPWSVYPVAVPENDPSYKDYVSNDANMFGQWRFDYALLDFKPNIVLDVRDFWNFTFEDTSCLRPFYHWLIAPTYDSSPQKIETINMFKNADVLMFHTDWAKNDLLNNFNYKYQNIGPVVNDAVDNNIFKPIGYSKSFHKIKFDIPKDTFILGTVMRNQKRKLIPDILKTFKNVIESTDKNIMLYMHTSYPDNLAWELPELLLEYNLQNKVLFTYTCRNCKRYYPSVWRGPKTTCKHCTNNSSFICSLRDPLDQKALNDIYNLFDTYIQYAICEGFGIPVVEAASVGMPIITIDFGAMGDVGKKLGASLVNVSSEFRELETNAIRCYPDNNCCKNIILQYLNMDRSELNDGGKKIRQNSKNSFGWNKTAKIFEDVIDSIDISKKQPWDSPQRLTNKNFSIKDNINFRSSIYDIIDHIIMEPWLKNTTFVENLIKSSSDGYTVAGNKIIQFQKMNAIKMLEMYLNNKIGLELIRKNMISMPNDLNNFINYNK